MNEIAPRSGKHRTHRHRNSFRSSRRSSTVPVPQIDWASIVLDSLPQEPPKNLADVVWNAYKDELWKTHKPDSRILFELSRLAARDPHMPDGMKFLANILAVFCVIDGYGATVEGLRKKERTRMLTGRTAAIPPSFPVWPS